MVTKEQLRALLCEARDVGIARLESDKTTFATDDQDCYPRAIHVTMDASRVEWTHLEDLEKEIEWLRIDRNGRTLFIAPPRPIKFRLTEFGYKQAIAQHLDDHGIACYVDVNWH
jgi:hypothetical protein